MYFVIKSCNIFYVYFKFISFENLIRLFEIFKFILENKSQSELFFLIYITIVYKNINRTSMSRMYSLWIVVIFYVSIIHSIKVEWFICCF